jgi:predicted amidohydrolase YtcJ
MRDRFLLSFLFLFLLIHAVSRETRGKPAGAPDTVEHEFARGLNTATLLNVQKDLGTIEPGKLADLVIVEGNPLRTSATRCGCAR